MEYRKFLQNEAIRDEIAQFYWEQIELLEKTPIIDPGSLHAIAVLGAPLDPLYTNEIEPENFLNWEFSEIMEEREGEGEILADGDRRAEAAAVLSDASGGKIPFWITGGVQRKMIGNRMYTVSKSTHMAQRIHKYGVPEKMIIPIGSDSHGNTIGNFQDIQVYLQTYSQYLKTFKTETDLSNLNIGFLTSLYQLPRTIELMSSFGKIGHSELEWLSQDERRFYPIAAESVTQKKFNIDEPAVKKRIEMEMKGIQDLRDGKYKPILR